MHTHFQQPTKYKKTFFLRFLSLTFDTQKIKSRTNKTTKNRKTRFEKTSKKPKNTQKKQKTLTDEGQTQHH